MLKRTDGRITTDCDSATEGKAAKRENGGMPEQVVGGRGVGGLPGGGDV